MVHFERPIECKIFERVFHWNSTLNATITSDNRRLRDATVEHASVVNLCHTVLTSQVNNFTLFDVARISINAAEFCNSSFRMDIVGA